MQSVPLLDWTPLAREITVWAGAALGVIAAIWLAVQRWRE
jgi:hypothetical protein